MVIGEANINNIMSGIESTGGVRLHNHRKKLKQRFDIIKKLGQGTYGKVQLGINKETGQEVAIKTIKKCKIETEADLIRIRREIQIMSSVQHPNIIHIYEVFENREKMVLVMEYAAGGELYDYLSERKVLVEDEARRIFRQIAIAVYYCHKHKICHRDLKLENILLDENGNAKIADFGLSNVFDKSRLLSTFCGSPLYASPEIVKGKPYHGPEVDCWSLGVLLYTLVYGAMPFDGSNFKRLVKQISHGDYFEPKTPSPASTLIRDMLTVSPTERANMEEICSHWWVNETYNESCLDIAEELANRTPVRLDLLLSLVPPPPEVGSDKLVIANNENSPDSVSVPEVIVPTRSMSVGSLMDHSSANNDVTSPKRKLDVTVSTENVNQVTGAKRKERSRKKERQKPEKSDTMTLTPAPVEEPSKQDNQNEENCIENESGAMCTELLDEANKKGVVGREKRVKKPFRAESVSKIVEEPEIELKKEEIEQVAQPPTKPIERRKSKIFETAEKFQNMAVSNDSKTNIERPKKIFIPGVNVGDFKQAFERRASLDTETIKKAQSKTIESPTPKKVVDNSSTADQDKLKRAVSVITNAIDREGARKSKSRPTIIRKPPVPFGAGGRSASGGIAQLSAPIQSPDTDNPVNIDDDDDDNVKKSSLEVNLKSATLPRRKTSKAEITLHYPQPKPATMEFKTEMQHRIDNYPQLKTQRSEVAFPISSAVPKVSNFRSTSLEPETKEKPRERIIPISLVDENGSPPITSSPTKPPAPRVQRTVSQGQRTNSMSRQSTQDSDTDSTSTQPEPIRKSPREFIIPIAIEGGGYVTPRAGSLEPSESSAAGTPTSKFSGVSTRFDRRRTKRMNDRDGSEDESPFTTLHRHSSIGRDSDNEDSRKDFHFHRLRSSRPNKRLDHTDSLSSGEEDDDDGFELLTAENLFSTLLSRVRSLTQRLNVEDGGRPGFPSSRLLSHFGRDNFWDNFHNREPFRNAFGRSFNRSSSNQSDSNGTKASTTWQRPSSASSTTNNLNSETSNSSSHTLPRDSYDQNSQSINVDDLDLSALRLSDKDAAVLSYLTPGLSRRIKRQLFSQLSPSQAKKLTRTLSVQQANTTPTSSSSSRNEIIDEQNEIVNNKPPVRRVSEGQLPICNNTIEIEQPPPPPTTTKTTTTKNNNTELKNLKYNCLNRRSLSYDPSKLSDLRYTKRDQISPFSETDFSSCSDTTSATSIHHNTDLSESDRRLLDNYRRSRRAVRSNSLLDSTRNSLYKPPLPEYGTTNVDTDRPILSKYLYNPSLRSPSIHTSDYFKSRTLDRRTFTQPRRVSRFLRPDFYNTPPDESTFVKEKQERELETQKVLKEIRDKRLKKRLGLRNTQECCDINDKPPPPPASVEPQVDKIDVAATKSKIAKLIRPKSCPEKQQVEPPQPDESPKPSNRNKFLHSLEKKFEKLRAFSSANNEDSEKISRVGSAIRRLREQSLPRTTEPIATESGLIKRAVSVENISNITNNPKISRKSVSKILNLFKKYEVKDAAESTPSEETMKTVKKSNESGKVKSKIPASKTKSESSTTKIKKKDKTAANIVKTPKDDETVKKTLNRTSKLPLFRRSIDLGESLKLNTDINKKDVRKSLPEANCNAIADNLNGNKIVTTSAIKTDENTNVYSPKDESNCDNWSVCSPDNNSSLLCDFNHSVLSGDENESVIDRIRRKSFYTRFNEKKRPRKSALVGPGADYNNCTYKTLPRHHQHDQIHLEPLRADNNIKSSSHSSIDSSSLSSSIPRKYSYSNNNSGSKLRTMNKLYADSSSSDKRKFFGVEDSFSNTGNGNRSNSHDVSSAPSSSSTIRESNLINNNNETPDH